MPTHDPNNPEESKIAHPVNLAHQKGESGDFMTLHQDSDPESRKVGYELTDANVRETAIFLVVLLAGLMVIFVVAYGIGTLINDGIARQDGPTNKWSRMAGVKPANVVSDPQIKQEQLDQMVKKFPRPRLQIDDGNVEVANMHAREDMLLNHYTWVDQQKQTVRIPIARAMQLLAQRGLPVEAQPTGSNQGVVLLGNEERPGSGQSTEKQSANAASTQEQPMFGDGSEAVTTPLTDGFARTGPELRMMEARQQEIAVEGPRGQETAPPPRQ